MSRRPAAPTPAPGAVAATAPWWAHALALLAVAVLASAPYLPSLGGGFVYDDTTAVAQNPVIRSLTPIRPFLAHGARPLTDYSYAIDYAIGGLSPAAYHATGIALHAATALLLYALAWLLLGLPALAPRYGAARRQIAVAAAVLFAVHPLASEAVAYISGRGEALAAPWYLVAVIGFVRAATAAAALRRRAWVGLTIVAVVAGATSAGTVFTLVAVLPALDWLLLAGRRWRRVHWRLIAASLLPLALGVAVLLLRARRVDLGDAAAALGFRFDRFGPLQYLATQVGVVGHYLELVVWPAGQTFDYDWPLASAQAPLAVIAPLVALGVLAVGAWRLRATQPLVTFVAAWVLLTLAPTSSLLPLGDLAVERRMYLPLTALALLAAAWLCDLCGRLPGAERTRPARVYYPILAALAAALLPLTWQRAVLWGDAIALHEDGARQAPGNPRLRLNLGVTYLDAGDWRRAHDTLLEAERLYDRGESVQAVPRIGAFIQYNLGAVLYARKQYADAESHLRRSLELGGQYRALRPMASMLLGRVAAERGDWKAAIEHLQEALRYRDDPDWRVDLAQMYLRGGDRAAAAAQLRDVLARHPGFARAVRLEQRLAAAPPAGDGGSAAEQHQ